MTTENRLIVGIEDMVALSLECNHCKIRLTYDVDNIGKVPPNCPNPSCNKEWYSMLMDRSVGEPRLPVLLKLIAAITEIKHRQKQSEIENPASVNFRVLLEFHAK